MTITINHFKTRVVRYPLLALCAGAALVVTGLNRELGKSDWAAWVQAIGSIAALLVAIFVMKRQNKHATELLIDADKRALLRRANAVGAVLDRAYTQLPQICNQIILGLAAQNEDFVKASLTTAVHMVKELQIAIRSIPAHELGSYEMVSGLYKTMEALSGFDKAASTWLSRSQLPPWNEIGFFVTVCTNACFEAKEVFTTGVEKLRNEPQSTLP